MKLKAIFYSVVFLWLLIFLKKELYQNYLVSIAAILYPTLNTLLSYQLHAYTNYSYTRMIFDAGHPDDCA